jgi:hypothetical protein
VGTPKKGTKTSPLFWSGQDDDHLAPLQDAQEGPRRLPLAQNGKAAALAHLSEIIRQNRAFRIFSDNAYGQVMDLSQPASEQLPVSDMPCGDNDPFAAAIRVFQMLPPLDCHLPAHRFRGEHRRTKKGDRGAPKVPEDAAHQAVPLFLIQVAVEGEPEVMVGEFPLFSRDMVADVAEPVSQPQ